MVFPEVDQKGIVESILDEGSRDGEDQAPFTVGQDPEASRVGDFRNKLRNAQRAPKSVTRTSLAGTKALIHDAAPVVIRECLIGNPKGFTARQVFNQVPAFGALYTDANALGTALGAGVCGKGLGLHRDAAREFRRTRDNACLAAAKLTDDEFVALATSMGYPSADALADAIDRLPPA